MATGNVLLVLRDENGIKSKHFVPNLVVNAGVALIADRLKDTSSTVMSHMAIGTTNTAAAGAQTALVAEAARVALTSTSNATTTVSNDSLTYVATFAPGTGTGTIVEAGLFNADTAGTMLARTVFSGIVKGSGDYLEVTWTVKVA